MTRAILPHSLTPTHSKVHSGYSAPTLNSALWSFKRAFWRFKRALCTFVYVCLWLLIKKVHTWACLMRVFVQRSSCRTSVKNNDKLLFYWPVPGCPSALIGRRICQLYRMTTSLNCRQNEALRGKIVSVKHVLSKICFVF